MRQAIAAVGLLGLAACIPRAEGGNQAATASPATSSVGSPTAWQAENACALLDNSTVGAALGTEIVSNELTSVVQRGAATAGFSTCLYKLADGQQLAFMARQSPDADNTPDAMKRAKDESSALTGPVEPVTGVGKGAFWSPGTRQLVVFQGDDRYFNLTMPANLGAKDPKTIALGLATLVK